MIVGLQDGRQQLALKETFDVWWPGLKEKINNMPPIKNEIPKRAPDDILEELIRNTRDQISSRRWNGIRANSIRVSASSSPTWRGRPLVVEADDILAARASNGSRRGKGAIRWTRLSCRSFAANAARLQLHAAISCARWRRRSRSRTGR
jgi:hypothetical protein